MTNELHHDQILDSSIAEEGELSSIGLSGSPIHSSLSISSVSSSTKIVTFSGSDLYNNRVSEWDVLNILSGPAIGKYFIDSVIDETNLIVKGDIVDDATGTSTADIYYRAGACTVGFDEARVFGAEEHVGEAGYVVRGKSVQAALEDLGYKFWAQREPTGYVDRSTTIMNFNDSTRVFRIESATSGHWHYYIRGILHEYDSFEEVTIPDVEGLYFIYFVNGSPSGTLVYSLTPWGFEDEVAFTTIVYWDAENKKSVLFLEERHGCSMDWASHRRWHRITGSEIPQDDFSVYNFIEGGDGSLDSHCQFAIEEGTLFDEDIDNVIVNVASPVNPFEQILSPICYADILYVSGPNAYLRNVNPTQFPVITDPANTPKYNLYTGGSWTLANVTDGWHFVMWLVVTNDRRNPIKLITGLYQEPDLITASQSNLWEDIREVYKGILQEYHPLKKIIFKASTSYANTPNAVITAITDYAQSPALNDRYSKQFSYNGNAGTNKYLELYAGQSSFDSPFTLPENSFIRTITVDTVAPSTGVLGFFLKSNPSTPIFTISFSNQSEFNSDYSEYFVKGSKLFVQVISGSFTKPGVSIYVQTDTF